jgi:uncharacterized protein (TIGR02145 family)
MRKINTLIISIIFTLFLLSCGGEDRTERIKELYEAINYSHDGLTWSDVSNNNMTWDDATSYCQDLGVRLPTISELRTLIQNCPATETGGNCKVTDSCLSWDDCRNDACDGCSYDTSGGYSVFGDTDSFWSSSERSDYTGYAWSVYFESGNVRSGSKLYKLHVRCVY